jgi:hypothetical protein
MKLRASAILALVAPLLVGSCALHFPDAGHVRRVEVASAPPERRELPTIPVVLFADELHTGLVLDLEWLQRHGYVPPRGPGRLKWAAFSWGDEMAYVQKEWLGVGQVFAALFQPSPAVMEIITFDYNIPNVCHHQRLYQSFVRESDGAPLAAFLNACSVRDDRGFPQTIGPSSWGEGLLIRSPHAYYLPRICNVWTVDALNAAGFRMNALTGLTAGGVVRQARQRRNGFQQIWDPVWKEDAAP